MQANESLLEAALTESFTPPPSRRQSKIVPAPTSSSLRTELSPTPAEALENSEITSEDAWKNEYEEQVKTWRLQSAEAREKAERERAKWEALREAEKFAGVPPPPPLPVQQNSPSPLEMSDSPSPADARDLVTGETPKATSHSRQLTSEDSQKWEHLPSEVTSSLPSMSFPEDSGHEETGVPPSQSPPTAPTSATLSVFDNTLSTSTRVKAFASALAINLLLPFVNGVMLGFGEIFAKNVVLRWFGWGTNVPRSTAASLGLRGKSHR
ncbi:hypothetical protein F5879DRAFT_926657 [Lentinula edodes]|uniref:uncharacterized protein n=1 Tax=Lentinula edodes TaxID=5353 RepID=UPI001E8ED248|nr:uncharacterized protein C8R40DRAFT_1070688 [Lentinula edodes]KAH7873844.1 hypothetical protein C8R40DRAFT_1070688 [Lentinula edodes]KAJ3898929.1 hypothetical protein F5879DRAFT_926657 [Lentinula edodes]